MSDATDSPPSEIQDATADAPSDDARVLRTAADLQRLREARGFSPEDAGRHLRIGPRQIAALEAGDWAALPGNAFVRGAIRAYARWLDADAAPLLASLGDAGGSPELRAPASLQTPMPRPGMLGFEAGGSGSRWAWVALVLAGLAVIALYFAGQGGMSGVGSWLGAPAAPAGAPPSTVPVPASSADPASPSGAPTAPGTPGTVVDPVPIGGAATSPPPAGGSTAPATAPPGLPAGTPTLPAPGAPASQGAAPTAAPPGAVSPSAVPPGVVLPPVVPQSGPSPSPGGPAPSAPAPSAPAPSAPAPSAPRPPAQGSAPAGAPAELRLTLREESWIEVRAADGAVLLSGSQPAGAARTISGARPLRVVVGNAGGVALEFDGRPVDVAAQARSNVARLELR